MAGNLLAEPADVESDLGRKLSDIEAARVDAILAKASGLFRRESRQEFTAGRSEVRLKVDGGDVILRQFPATEVHDVVDDAGSPVSYTWFKQRITVPRASHEFVIVDYSHGGEVPELVRLKVAEIAAKVLLIDPKAARGVVQGSETTGPFTEAETYAAWAVGGQANLAPEDKALARSFRTKVPKLWVPQS